MQNLDFSAAFLASSRRGFIHFIRKQYAPPPSPTLLEYSLLRGKRKGQDCSRPFIEIYLENKWDTKTNHLPTVIPAR